MISTRTSLAALLVLALGIAAFSALQAADTKKPAAGAKKPAATSKPKATAKPKTAVKPAADAGVGPGDWAQWGGDGARNNTPQGKNIPTDWDVGELDDDGNYIAGSGRNIKWVVPLGSQTYSNPVVAGGKLFIGTNNGGGHLDRYPASIDLGVMLAFNEADGKFLWQHSSEKLPTGRVHDWPLLGLCSTGLVEGDRLYFLSNRNVLVCVDTYGFQDGENDGPFKSESQTGDNEADTVWELNMMASPLSVSQHNAASCSVTTAGDLMFVCTSNGVDEAHNENLPAPDAPSFVCLNKHDGKILWTDKSPGVNILHGQWSSPAYAVIKGQAQVIFAGGDGWLYSFDPAGDGAGNSKLLWKFDCNPKESRYEVSGRATRNHIIGTPVIYDDKVYVAVGEDPEHGEGPGHLWCVDPTKQGDISPELVFNKANPDEPIPHKRLQACVEKDGDFVRDNKNSGAIWHYSARDFNNDGKIDSKDFAGTMHRSIGSVCIKDDILVIADFSGLVHCLDAQTGEPHWTHDLLSATWGSPLIVEDKIYVGDEDGDVMIYKLSKGKPDKKGITQPEILTEDDNGINMGSSVYGTPIVANNVLYIASKTHLYAIVEMEEGEAVADEK
ncbi:MAG: PQQ-binding-like beta-propeller repeat protein [Pirellulales bacterium]